MTEPFPYQTPYVPKPDPWVTASKAACITFCVITWPVLFWAIWVATPS